ncbi:methyltransferase-like protein 27 [Asterias amurensis]|uniref:methyltransferase-like protein 27 n=1 Tax=Asterias amurensis TaxID=7602 RepID=UPI003AB368F8
MGDKIDEDKYKGTKPAWANCAKEDFRSLRQTIWESNKRNDKILQMYDDFAVHYKQASLIYGYVGHSNFADVVTDVIIDKTARILDAASGVGMVGEEMKKRGFINIDALDPSKTSLDLSKTLDVYTNFICETLNEHRTQIQDDFYDVVMMCASLGLPGHVTESCLPELIRITKPGGFIILTVTEKSLFDFKDKLDAAIEELTKKGLWEVLETRWIGYMKGEDCEKAMVPIIKVK